MRILKIIYDENFYFDYIEIISIFERFFGFYDR